MFLAILRYIPSAVVDILADILAFILAPIAALPVFIKTDKDGREEIKSFWKWITTHDAPIDIYTYSTGRSKHWYLKRYTVEEIRNSAWLRYASRVFWIWRNPAYAVSHKLGYNQVGVEVPEDGFKDPRWDTGESNHAFWKVKNAKGQTGFLYQRQLYFTKHRCIEIQFGWKLYRRDPDQRCMLAFRISPFKKY